MALNTESLTYWYFRLNGFFTIPNFVVHPDRGAGQKTEVDVLGLRLRHHRELLENPMVDDDVFTGIGDKAFIAITGVKTGLIDFNDTWRAPELQNVQRFLRAVGAFATDCARPLPGHVTGLYFRLGWDGAEGSRGVRGG